MKKLYYQAPFLIILASFGPYVIESLGLRTDHFAIYGLFVLLIPWFLLMKPVLVKNSFIILAIWGSVFLFALIRTFFDMETRNIFKVLAAIESFFQPIAILIILSLTTSRLKQTEIEKEHKIKKASQIIINLLCINTVWIIVGFAIDTSSINQYFWGSAHSVASNAAEMGRYSGIFNQPAESGMIYSVGLLVWIYINEKAPKITFKQNISLILLLLGGVVSVSKIFLFGGTILFILYILFFGKRIRKQIIKLLFFLGVIGYGVILYLNNTWNGVNYLFRFTNSNQNLLYLLSAGRFGNTGVNTTSQQSNLFSHVWNTHPLIGNGFGIDTVFDTAFYHFFGTAGLFGLIFYIILIFSFLFIALVQLPRKTNKTEVRLFLFLILLIIGGSFGVPVLVLNRVSAVIWVLIALLFQLFSTKNHITVQPIE